MQVTCKLHPCYIHVTRLFASTPLAPCIAQPDRKVYLSPCSSITCASYTYEQFKWAALSTGDSQELLFIVDIMQFNGHARGGKYEDGLIFFKCFKFTSKQLRLKAEANTLRFKLSRLVQLLKAHSAIDCGQPGCEQFPFHPDSAVPYGSWSWTTVNFLDIFTSHTKQVVPLHYGGPVKEGPEEDQDQLIIFTYR
jgi:hypothetical protein